ncbi:hypothetical protein DF035_11865 [Burkholderia contaminans]|nr:hypothetical protein DF035_11865 [Burkholderia contaminans]
MSMNFHVGRGGKNPEGGKTGVKRGAKCCRIYRDFFVMRQDEAWDIDAVTTSRMTIRRCMLAGISEKTLSIRIEMSPADIGAWRRPATTPLRRD